MDQDLLWFLMGIAGFVAYLIFSAITEMGTRWPRKEKDESDDHSNNP